MKSRLPIAKNTSPFCLGHPKNVENDLKRKNLFWKQEQSILSNFSGGASTQKLVENNNSYHLLFPRTYIYLTQQRAVNMFKNMFEKVLK